jgi:hypothetical protein
MGIVAATEWHETLRMKLMMHKWESMAAVFMPIPMTTRQWHLHP